MSKTRLFGQSHWMTGAALVSYLILIYLYPQFIDNLTDFYVVETHVCEF
jgi:hypothetical protein